MGIATQTSDGLKFNTTYMYVKNNSGTTLAAISSGGNLGIGTASPSYKLDVNGDVRVNGSTSAIDANYGVFLGTYSGGTNISPGELVLATQAKTGWGPGDELGRIRFWLGDASGVGRRDVAKIIAVNEDGNGSTTTTASGALAFYTSNYNSSVAERVRIAQDGKVGLGASSPTARFQINNDYTIDANYGSADLYVKETASQSSYDPDVQNTTDLQALITVSSNNTAGPDKPGLVLYNDDNTAGGFSPMLLFSKRESGSSPYKATMAGIYARSPLGTGDNNSWIDGELIFATAGASTSGITQRMVINKEGLVGIGTTSPSAQLEISSSSALSLLNIEGSGGNNILYVSGSGRVGIGTTQLYENLTVAGQSIGIRGDVPQLKLIDTNSNSDYNLVNNNGNFGIYDSTNAAYRLYTLANGNVGIGTTSPSYKLDVNGDASATTLLSDYRRLRSYGNFSTSTNNTAGWYPLAHWGTSSGNRGGFIIYVSYTGGSWGPTTYVIKVFKDWGSTGTILVEKYGGNNYITDVRIIANSSSVYYLELYLTAQSVGHSFSAYYEGYGYDESGTSTMTFVNTSLALSTNTGTVAASMGLGMGQGLATVNALVRDNLFLGSRMYHYGDNDTYLGFNTNEAFLVAGSINALHLYSTEAVVNENGANFNFRVEGATDQNLLVCDASADKVGIGTASPSYPLTVAGADSIGIDDYILHNGDGNTKFGFSGADTFKIRTAGVDALFVNSSQNVGIGTASPTSAKLEIHQNSGNNFKIFGQSALEVFGIGATGVTTITGQTGSTVFGITNSGAGDFMNVGGGSLYVQKSGNVGIGTVSPTEKLEVSGSILSNSFGVSGSAVTPSFIGVPQGGSYNSNSTETGYLKINLPIEPVSTTDVTVSFKVRVSEGSINKISIYNVTGTLSGATIWQASSAYFETPWKTTTGATSGSFIDLGRDGTSTTGKSSVLINSGRNELSSWFSPIVQVYDVSIGGVNTYNVSDWLEGWNVSFTTSKLGYTNTSYAMGRISGTNPTPLKYNQSKSGTVILSIQGNWGGFQRISLASGTTIQSISYTNIPVGYSVTIAILLLYGGTATVTWTNVKWSGGVTPTLTGVNGKADLFTITSYDGGSNWIGSVVAQNLDSTNL